MSRKLGNYSESANSALILPFIEPKNSIKLILLLFSIQICKDKNPIIFSLFSVSTVK